ncbi:MAG: DegT/DnrJ/EryC1/StrS family aminotransferase [Clostridiales bacterium]|nr:DegT/DnrJ/EryC1/StrS family aminotransferase [Clostridiales bacterium]
MKFRDLGAQYQQLKAEIDTAISQVLEGSAFILGQQVGELEQRLADYVGVRHCVSCANGTDALQLVLMAWGIGPGDAVFTSNFTFFASAGCASILGAQPVLVDIEPDTFNLCPDDLERRIAQVKAEGRLTPRAIIPVDLFGQPADYPRIEAIARRHGLLVLEDGAQGFGGAVEGKRVCGFGDAAITSFFPAKPLGCYGDGGAIFTDDDRLATTLRSLRAQGRSPQDKYDNREIGMNSRLDTLQAAILLPKLKAFEDHELEAVNQVAAWYDARLKGQVITPVVRAGYTSSWAQYTIRLQDARQRDGLQQHLRQQGIPSMVYYPRGLHQQGAFLHLGLGDEDYPQTSAATRQVLSLPMHPYLREEEVDQVCRAVLAYLRGDAGTV